MGGGLKLTAVAAIAAVMVGGIAQADSGAGPPGPGEVAPNLGQLAVAVGGPGADATSPRYAHLAKLDNSLQMLAADELRGRPLKTDAELLSSADAQAPGGSLIQGTGAALSARDEVLVDVYVEGSVAAAAGRLRELGMRVSAVNQVEPQRLVEGWLPVGALVDASRIADAEALRSIPAEQTNAGSVLSEGDAAHLGPAARALGATGAGVRVGVISNSINRAGGGVAGSQATGNLPANVSVLLDGTLGSNDEGRAMAEIIYDTAPGITNMSFTTGTSGAATRATGIDNLVAQGAKVIADDTFQITEPFFQDGVVAQAVDRAHAAGVTYLVSAGNRARQSWEGTYAPMTDPRAVSPSTADFDPGPATDAIQTVGDFMNRNLFISLQWDERFGGAATDLAVDVYGITAGTPTYAFTIDTNNITTGLPAEFVSINVIGGATVGIAIRRVSGARNPFMKYILGGVPATAIAEHATHSSAIDPDAASAKGALAIAASNFATPATPEAFSSRGPTVTRFFDVAGNRLSTPEVRAKPDLSAADAVATSVGGFSPFFGTSAAAPSAAGIAALMRSAKPTMPESVIRAILTNPANAIDCTATAGVPDLDCGSGFILADRAVAQSLDSTPPSISPVTVPSAPDGSNGYFVSDVTLTWNVTDSGSPPVELTGCGTSSVTTDGITSATCGARSAGGPSTATATIKRDGSPPGKPTFKGIKAKTYSPNDLPKKKKVRCKSTDSVSGISKCKVKGFSTKAGKHTLKATATNGAGLTGTAKLKYEVR